MKKRLAVAAALGLVAIVTTYALLTARGPAIQGGDFTYPWAAARALLAGRNPYASIGPADVPFGGAFYYPLTAALLAAPFADASASWGGAIVVGIGFAMAAFALSKAGWWRLLALASAPAYATITSVQWSPLLMAGALLPALLFVALGVKPNLGVALLSYQTGNSNWRAVALGVAIAAGLALVALALQPRWPVEWLATLHRSPDAGQFLVPCLTPIGIPLLASLSRWRDRDARLLFCLSLVPQTTFLYDQLLVLLIPKSRLEMLVAVVASWLVLLAPEYIHFDRTNAVTLSHAYQPLVVGGIFLPALLIVASRGLRERAARRQAAFEARDGNP